MTSTRHHTRSVRVAVLRALIGAAALVGAASPAAALGTFGLPPGAPWPGPVAGAENPLGQLGAPNNGVSATAEARLKVWLGRSRGASAVTRRIGARTYLHGRLYNRNDRHGIARAGIFIVREVTDHPGWTVAAIVATSRHGAFRFRVPRGPSRRFAAIYWPHSVSVVPIYSRRLTLRSASRVTLSARRGRRGMVRFSGRVSGAAIPVGGLLVNIQVANRGSWPSVRTVHTAPDGRFVGRYRFTGRRPSGFVVRAQVLRQTGWRLYTASSRLIRIHPK
ncbi:MAG: hypothetical protein ACRDLN_02520 [Solirubrobacteraceae bacterium]